MCGKQEELIFDYDSLVIVRDERDIQGLDLKPTFAGKVLTEGSKIPKTVFACQVASIEAIKEAMRKHVMQCF